MDKKFKVNANVDLYFDVRAENKTEAKNNALKVFDDIKRYAQLDVNSLNISES